TNSAVAGSTGRLPWPTWPSGFWLPPFTQIDHVLVRDLAPIEWRLVAIDGTDHRGIVTKVTLAKESAVLASSNPAPSPTTATAEVSPIGQPSPTASAASTNQPALVSANWAERGDEGGRTLMVVPAPWVRQAMRGGQLELGQAALEQLWAELVAAEPQADLPTMHNQLTCHGLGAPDKSSWNLEPWRPDVGLAATILARCNPVDPGD
ncbi:MAG: DUF2599 domain-containing protein, partial [Micrococcales bacterium]|nr:DUF2599 domain-containing protein [Micrococcales bacterium]